MSIIRVSMADLRKKAFSFTEEEKAFLNSVTDEELHAAALADPDNQPWTSEMFEDARQRRSRRCAREGRGHDVEIRAATPSSEAEIWAVTDKEGRTVFLPAVKVERADVSLSGPLYEIVHAPATGPS